MSLPIVNPFSTPYEAWSTRKLSYEESMARNTPNIHVRDKRLALVDSAMKAAEYMAEYGADNALDGHIDGALSNDPAHAAWRRAMPSKTPDALARYQKQFPDYDRDEVTREIQANGVELPAGQFLFHAGVWPSPGLDVFVTGRPLSTTFCPQVAMRNAEHNAKAYDANQIDLWVVRVQAPKTNAFVFRIRGTDKGHEKEVLFAAGATLTLRNRVLIRSDYLASKWGQPDKNIRTYVLEVDIS